MAVKWWKAQRLRSGKAWASGPSYWSAATKDDDNFIKYEKEVALIDAINGGLSADRSATMNLVTGGNNNLDNDTIQKNSLLDWTGEGHWVRAWLKMPSGTWMVWELDTISEDRRTDTGSDTIWTDISSGKFDRAYTNMGRRIRKNFITPALNPRGHLPGRLILRMNHEMNQSNSYQVFDSTTLKYKRAMERTIQKIRDGLGDMGDKVKFLHAPAHGSKLGSYDSWCPNNVDALAVSWHPNKTVRDKASLDNYIKGDARGYGLIDVLNYSNKSGLPIALPEHSPRYEWGDTAPRQYACPISDLCMDALHKFLTANKDMIVCDCMFHVKSLDPKAFEGPDKEGAKSWARGVNRFKTLWSGEKLK